MSGIHTIKQDHGEAGKYEIRIWAATHLCQTIAGGQADQSADKSQVEQFKINSKGEKV